MSQQTFGLAVRAFVKDAEGNVLLIRRSPESRHYGGQWDLPGGKVDPGETFDVGLRREIAEETGLEATVEQHLGSTQFDMPGVRVVILFMEAQALGRDVRLSDEHDAFEWVPKKKLVEMNISDQLKDFVLGYANLG
jgi:8-oxo-dGTP diphosphatase